MIRFSLSENPQSPGTRSEGGAGIFIIHHISPISIIEVDIFQGSPVGDKAKQYVYLNSDGQHEHYVLTIRHCWWAFGTPDPDINKLLTRAWHWFAAYMEWEDKNIDKG